jgi:hypothetical protein
LSTFVSHGETNLVAGPLIEWHGGGPKLVELPVSDMPFERLRLSVAQVSLHGVQEAAAEVRVDQFVCHAS